MVTVSELQPGQAVVGPQSEQNRSSVGSSGTSRQKGNCEHSGKPGKLPAGLHAPLKLHPQRSPQTGPIKPPGIQLIPCTEAPQEV